MKRIQKRYTKNTLAVAVLMAIGGTAQADVDGWSFSEQNARSTALQSGYMNLIDSYNVWVNPALVVKNSNHVDVRITDNGSRDEDSAGAFKTWGDNTFGAYLGRPSGSLLGFVNVLSDFNNLSTYGATRNSEAVPDAPAVNNPRNQFDLFWGTSTLPTVNLGARLNFQAISNSHDLPVYTSQAPNVFQTTDPTRTTDTVSNNDTDTSARELNLAFGVADKAGVWDATLLYGRPSSDSKSALTDQRMTETLVAGAYTARAINDFDGTQKVSSNGAKNLGLAARWLNPVPNSIATFMYQRQDNSYKNKINSTVRDRSDGGVIGTVDGTDFDNTTSYTESGKFTLKDNAWSLWFTRNFTPVANSLVIATLGLAKANDETKTVNTVTANSTLNNLNATTTYNNGVSSPTTFARLGTQTNSTYKDTSTTLPLILGFESQVTSSTTLRAAVRKNLYQSFTTRSTTETWAFPASGTVGGATATNTINTVTKKDKTTSVWDTDTTLTLGAGYKVDSFIVDAVLQKEFVTAGVDNGLVSRVNVTYLLP